MAELTAAQLVLDAYSVTTIINNINSLYSTAIEQLTSYTLAVVGLVGVLIPILVTIYQARSVRAEKEMLQAHINDEISKARIQMREEIASELTNSIKAAEMKLTERLDAKLLDYDKQISILDASTFHIQGNLRIESSSPFVAAEDYCHATLKYLSGGDEGNGQRTLNLLTKRCLPLVTRDWYEKVDLGASISEVINLLQKMNDTGKYTDQIFDLRMAMKEASNRDNQPEAD